MVRRVIGSHGLMGTSSEHEEGREGWTHGPHKGGSYSEEGSMLVLGQDLVVELELQGRNAVAEGALSASSVRG